jgi:cytochrome c553
MLVRYRQAIWVRMNQVLKWTGLGAAVLAGLAFLAVAFAWLYSESVIARHYPLLSIDVPATDTPQTIARGLHLAKVAGCFGCHGDRLRGRPLAPIPGFKIHSANLMLSIKTLGDEQFARALRDGLKPDGTSLWVMPSEDYVYMSNADIAAIVSYVHSLPVGGQQAPPPKFKRHARIAILTGDLESSAMRIDEDSDDDVASLDLGPRYEGGRYLTRISCAQCHALDLDGTPDGRVPSLTVLSHYSLRDFFELMRRGDGRDHRRLAVMGALARPRFSDFKDYEVMALYDYLSARAAALPHE